MKNTKSSNWLYFLLGIVLIAGIVGVFQVFYQMFYNLVKDDFRSIEVALTVVVFVGATATAMFVANDVRSQKLARALAGISIGVAALLYFGNLTYEAMGNDLSKIDETLSWIPAVTFIVPVLCGWILWIRASLDRFWGEDDLAKNPIAKSSFLRGMYAILYNVGLLLALGGSALGTWSVAMAITHSSFHALTYVLTVEVPILVYSIWNHQTLDRNIFWRTFGVTCAAFGIAILFQLASAGMALSGVNVASDDTFSIVARNFYLLPPLAVLAMTGWLLYENQTRPFEPFSKSGRFAQSAVSTVNRPTPTFAPRPEPPASISAEQREELLSLGYDNPTIDAMKPQEALERLRAKVRAKSPVPESNHRDPQDF